MGRKLLVVIGLVIFILGYRYAYGEDTFEYKTNAFSFTASSDWKVVKEKDSYVKIEKDYGDGQVVSIMFAAMVDLDSAGRTAKEMQPDTMRLVKETNKRFKRFIEKANLPDLPVIKEVMTVLTDFTKVGNTYFVMSSMIFVPENDKIFPIGYVTMTCQENGRRYTVIITTKANSVQMSERMLDESLRLVESFKTFTFDKLPV